MSSTFFTFFAFFWTIQALLPVDRDVFMNYHGNIQHDGFSKFSSEPITPLSMVWSSERNFTQNGYSCSSLYSQPTVVIANGYLYCIAYLYTTSDSVESTAIMAIDLTSGDVQWFNSLYSPAKYVYLVGLAYSKNTNFLSVVDELGGNVWVLDADTGDVKQNIMISQEDCRGIETCVWGYTLGVDNGVVISWIDLKANMPYLTSLNFDKNTTQTILSPLTAFGFQLSICSTGSKNILLAEDNFYNLSAYNIDDDLNLGEQIWSDVVIYEQGVSFISPPICVPTLDSNDNVNGFQFLYSRKLDGAETDVYWILADGTTGDLVRRFEWTYDENLVRTPIIDTDNNIVIRCDYNNTIAEMLNSKNDGQWDSLYTISGNDFEDIIVINSYLYTVDENTIYVYNVKDGTFVDSYKLDIELRYASLGSGLDSNGRLSVVVIGYNKFESGTSVFVF